MEQYKMFELKFEGSCPEGSEAVIDLKAVFTNGNESKTVNGFYAGNGTYVVRFLPEKEGVYTWKVSGCVEASGEEECVKAVDGRSHGIVRAVGTHFEYEDGTPFKPFGTTIYAMMHQEKALIEQTYETLATAPFNKVRYCVFPKHYDYNHNEPELFAFEKDERGEWDVDHPCFAFWDHFESGIMKLEEMGIQTDLILFHPYDHWGFSAFSLDQCKVYLEYLIRRFSAMPSIWWSMANEYDLMLKHPIEDWYAIEQFIVDNDPYHHLLGNHNCLKFYDNSRLNITHCCVQTAWMEKAADWMRSFQKPVVYDECCYEGNLPLNWGNISAFEMVHRFWSACTVGAYCTHGEVFLSKDEVLWWAKGGILKGESPKRIAFLKSILDELPGYLEEWEDMPMADAEGMPPKEVIEQFCALRASLSEAELDALMRKDKDCKGHFKGKVYLQYLGRHCNALLRWRLPEGHKYCVEVIDVWNMTREKVLTGVSGDIEIKLPGREGMAVLAVEC